MRIYFMLLFTIGCYTSFCQKSAVSSSDSTSVVLKRVSSLWIADSLANNGYRLEAYKEVLNSKIDQIKVSPLSASLGKPNVVKNTNQGMEYWYYVYDTAKSKGSKGFEILYLNFLFDPTTLLLKKITENVMP